MKNPINAPTAFRALRRCIANAQIPACIKHACECEWRAHGKLVTLNAHLFDVVRIDAFEDTGIPRQLACWLPRFNLSLHISKRLVTRREVRIQEQGIFDAGIHSFGPTAPLPATTQAGVFQKIESPPFPQLLSRISMPGSPTDTHRHRHSRTHRRSNPHRPSTH